MAAARLRDSPNVNHSSTGDVETREAVEQGETATGEASAARCLLLFAFAVQFTEFCWEACRTNGSYLGSIMYCEVVKILKEAVMLYLNIPLSVFILCMDVIVFSASA
jgi:hypothetical protein